MERDSVDVEIIKCPDLEPQVMMLQVNTAGAKTPTVLQAVLRLSQWLIAQDSRGVSKRTNM